MRVPKYRLVRDGAVDYSYRVHGPIQNPENAARVLRGLIGDEVRECLAVLFLDTRGRAIGVHVAGVGVLDFCMVSSREIFGPAMLARAAFVIVAHNHPSGDAELSQEDRDVADQLEKAGKILGVPMKDFLALGENSWASVKG